jgi:hypothetical protein
MNNPTGNQYAYAGLDLRISSANVCETGFMLGERVKYTSDIGQAIISTANTNRDGTGAIEDLITGGTYGTIVNRITIKAQGSTSQGIVRLYIYGASTSWLIREIPVPAMTQAAHDTTAIAVIDDYILLQYNGKLRVSTEKANTFIVTAEGLQQTTI